MTTALRMMMMMMMLLMLGKCEARHSRKKGFLLQ
jgi:hypothetical protein